MRVIYKNVLNFTNSAKICRNLQIRNFVKFLRNEHVINLNEETLTGRILNYLNIDKDNHINPSIINNQKNKILTNFNENILKKCTIDELIYSMCLLKNVPNLQESSKLIQRFDTECTLRLNSLDNETIFKLLSVFMQILPNRINELKFYQIAMKELSETIEQLNKNELLQFIFYIGLKKKTLESRNALRKCMRNFNADFINNLTTEELCIICNSNFRTSTKIDNQLFLDRVRDCLNDHLYLLKDPQLLITLIKTIRHNRYQDENLLSTIACGVFFNRTLEFYNFSALCHILALFADYNYYDENILRCFTMKCLDELKHSKYVSKFAHLTQQLRGKDIKRFLWCLTNYSHYKLLDNDDFKQIIMPKILERIEMGEFDDDVDSLIDITLYLWILNYRAYELVPYVLTDKNLQIVQGKKTKCKERLNLLLHCIFIEDRDLFNKLNLKPIVPQNLLSIEYHLKRRPLLKRVMENLKLLSKQCDLNRFEFTYEIPYINIVGITGYKKKIYKTVFIEILDDITCLKNTNCDDENVPIGLMDLKLRLLDQSDEAVIVVSQEEVESMTESELQQFLYDEINLVCNI